MRKTEPTPELADLPPNWYATPEGRERWRPVMRELDRRTNARRALARGLFERALLSLTSEEAALVKKVYGL